MISAFKKTSCALAVLAITSTAVMASKSASVSITGTITPGACNVTLASSGVINYGDVSVNSLFASNPTNLEDKVLNFNIDCSARKKVYLRVDNDRPGTAAFTSALDEVSKGAPIPRGLPKDYGDFVFGLGKTTNGENIGGYTMILNEVKLDGANADSYISASGRTPSSWTTNSKPMNILTDASSLHSWSKKAPVAPKEFQNMTGKLHVKAYIAPLKNITINKNETFSGAATIEVLYL